MLARRCAGLALIVLVCSSLGCGDGGPLPPLEESDAGPPSPLDAGPAPREVDAGGTDPGPDGGDGGSMPDDAGPDGEPGEPAAACPEGRGGPGNHLLFIEWAGATRVAGVHVPDLYDPTAATRVVLNFHGLGSAGWQQAFLSGMNRRSNEQGFIVVYPEGMSNRWNAGACCDWSPAPLDDVGFVRALLDRLQTDYCVDRRRIHATGMSNGGFMSHRLACELSDRIASIAPVAGVLGLPDEQCRPARPVPVLAFHGTADALVPYEGGMPLGLPLATFRSVADTMSFWRTQHACAEATVETFAAGDVSCVAWTGCGEPAPVSLCTVTGGGHTWPGGLPFGLGPTTAHLSATDAMLEFFDAHPLP
jgi:polyhydroxybutyrate depolymerase